MERIGVADGLWSYCNFKTVLRIISMDMSFRFRNPSKEVIELVNRVLFPLSTCKLWEPGSSGSIVSDYGLDDQAIGVRFSAGAKDFSSILCVQTCSGAHPASCTMGTGGPFPGGKARPVRDADHSPPSSAEVRNVKELYLLSLQAPAWCVAGLIYLHTSYG
jgi:hypothetical protein